MAPAVHVVDAGRPRPAIIQPRLDARASTHLQASIRYHGTGRIKNHQALAPLPISGEAQPVHFHSHSRTKAVLACNPERAPFAHGAFEAPQCFGGILVARDLPAIDGAGAREFAHAVESFFRGEVDGAIVIEPLRKPECCADKGNTGGRGEDRSRRATGRPQRELSHSAALHAAPTAVQPSAHRPSAAIVAASRCPWRRVRARRRRAPARRRRPGAPRP